MGHQYINLRLFLIQAVKNKSMALDLQSTSLIFQSQMMMLSLLVLMES